MAVAKLNKWRSIHPTEHTLKEFAFWLPRVTASALPPGQTMFQRPAKTAGFKRNEREVTAFIAEHGLLRHQFHIGSVVVFAAFATQRRNGEIAIIPKTKQVVALLFPLI